MPLKTLIINGFKSFADKTTIEFTSGITGIVGPNGSGKSNITEAIRWVMGEQSAKSLRGSHMPDIIFAGSSLREPLNRAEVSLVFDNREQELTSTQPTVTVTRRLFRDGSSDFFINQQSCRLRDISDLFIDSGLGKASFSIISQGRVEEIFNSKPEERRNIIEEAAGVYKFKQQKHQAEQELTSTNENLNRVADIYSELKTRLEPLRQQASLARDYQQQKTAYDQLNQQIIALELDDLQQQQHETSNKQQELTTISVRIDQQASQSSQKLSNYRQDLDQINQKLEISQATFVQATRQQEALNGQVSLTTERSSYRKDSLSSLDQQLADLARLITEQEHTLTVTKANVASAEQQKQQLDRQLHTLTAKKAEGEDDIANHLMQLRTDYVDVLQHQTTARNQVVYQQDAVKKEKQQLTQLNSELEMRRNDKEVAAAELAKQTAQQQQQLTAVTTSTTKLQQTKVELEQVQANQQKLQQDWYQQLEHFQQLKARYQSLAEVTNDHNGFYLGVRAVLDKKNQLQGLLGAVADLMVVPPKFQVAIEQALGSQLQQIICRDATAAQSGIAFLKEHRLGRATFLPVTTIQPRHASTQSLSQASTMTGYLGVAAELVEMRPELHQIKQYLLGQLLVVTDLEAALKIAQKIHYQVRIVTLEGDILTPGGAMTGGRMKQKGQGLLNRQQDLKRQQDELKRVQQDLNQHKIVIEEGQARQKQLSANQAQQEIDLQQLTIEAQKISQAQQQQKQLTGRLTSDFNANELQQKRLRADLETSNLNLSEFESEQIKYTQQVNAVQEQINQDQQRLENFTSQKETLVQQINEAKTQQAVAQLTLKNQVELLARQQQMLLKQKEQVESLNLEQKKLATNVSQSSTDLSAIKTDLKHLTEKIELQQTALAELKKERDQINQHLTDLEPESQRHYQLQKQTAKELEEVAVKLNAIKTAMTSRLDELRETYHLSFEAAFSELSQQADLTTLRKQLKLVKLALADIGQVNLDAISEFEQVNERYQFLSSQQADLIAARQQLLSTMAEMDSEVITRFTTTFTAINKAFCEIFPKMFGGGQARLELTDETAPLTTGIEIKAQPPGKKLQLLSLLSGGERALTAITLLFAILKVRPAPFSILDEVEASLDEANVIRFANYLQHYEAKTQFIVITHRKGTMMQVDRLYGVTMQESGISKIISVSLTDLPATGN